MEKERNEVFRLTTGYWYVERAIFLMGGTVVALAAILALTVDSRFVYLDLLVGLMMIIFALTGWCLTAIIVHKLGVSRGIHHKEN